jgi:hypothetical protein
MMRPRAGPAAAAMESRQGDVSMKALGLGLLAAVTVSQGAMAQARALCADRPGKAAPACIVDVGRLQVEAGLADWARRDQDGERTDALALGGLELRTGLARRSEVELGWTAYSRVHDRVLGATARTRGVGDLFIGARTALTDPDRDGPQVALQPFVTAPTATHGQGAGGWEGGVIAPVSLPVPGGLSLGFSPQLAVKRDAGGGGTHLDGSGAVAVSRGFGPLSVALELWGEMDHQPGGSVSRASADAAVAWIPASRPDLQVDVGLNLGLKRNTPDRELYAGIVRRF